MYSMNWVTYTFMRVRHVSMLGMLWGGGATRSFNPCARLEHDSSETSIIVQGTLSTT